MQLLLNDIYDIVDVENICLLGVPLERQGVVMSIIIQPVCRYT
jgi:hypothetical protein